MPIPKELKESMTEIKREMKNEPLLFAHLADLYLMCGNYSQAERILRKGVEHYPVYPAGWIILGNLFMTQSRPDDARAAYDRALELEQFNPAAHNQCGAISMKARNWNVQIAHLRESVRLDPLNDNTHSLLETALLKKAALDKGLYREEDLDDLMPDTIRRTLIKNNALPDELAYLNKSVTYFRGAQLTEQPETPPDVTETEPVAESFFYIIPPFVRDDVASPSEPLPEMTGDEPEIAPPPSQPTVEVTVPETAAEPEPEPEEMPITAEPVAAAEQEQELSEAVEEEVVEPVETTAEETVAAAEAQPETEIPDITEELPVQPEAAPASVPPPPRTGEPPVTTYQPSRRKVITEQRPVQRIDRNVQPFVIANTPPITTASMAEEIRRRLQEIETTRKIEQDMDNFSRTAEGGGKKAVEPPPSARYSLSSSESDVLADLTRMAVEGGAALRRSTTYVTTPEPTESVTARPEPSPSPTEEIMPEATGKSAETAVPVTDHENTDYLSPRQTERIATQTLGELYAAQGEYRQAVEVFEELVRRAPDNAKFSSRLLELRKFLGE